MPSLARAPERIGPYRVVRALRRDGSTESFLAQELGPLGFTRDVTLRCVSRARQEGVRSVELAHEARIGARLVHPSIAQVLDLFEDRSRYVLVVEGHEVLTLEDVLAQLDERGERLSDAAAAYVVATVAGALAFAHGSRDEGGRLAAIVHRRVAASAVVIGADGAIRLSGFGLAAVLGGAYGHEEGRQSLASDVWAVGALALQLFDDGVTEASDEDRARLSTLRADLPRELTAVVDATLSLDVSKRTVSSGELARWIGHVMDVRGGRRAFAEQLLRLGLLDASGNAQPAELGSRRRMRAIRRTAPERRIVRAALQAAAELELVEDPPHPEAEVIAAPPMDLALEIEAGALEVAFEADASPRAPPTPAPPPTVIAAARPYARAIASPDRLRRPPVAGRGTLLALALTLVAVATHARPPTIAHAAPAQLRNAIAAIEPPRGGQTQPSAPARPAITTPAKKPPAELGYLHVHTFDTSGRVFVAARAWGPPEANILVPCGRFYVNVARTDSKGTWAGWLARGTVIVIACDGSVTEVTLERAPPLVSKQD